MVTQSVKIHIKECNYFGYIRATRNLSGHGRFVEFGHFDKHFVKNTRKKGPAGKILEFFLLDTLLSRCVPGIVARF